MNRFHTHIRAAGHDISLTEGEKLRMRYAVTSYMQLRPLPGHARTERRTSTIPAFFWHRALAFVALLAVLGSSAGVSYAAESALPGDFLYSIKTVINEPVRGALATTPATKAQWAMQVAAERATEAATLAAEGRLDSSTQSRLATSLVAHAKVAEDALDEQATSAPHVTAQEAVRFEARLSEYERVIASIAEDSAESAPSMAAAIRSERERVASVRERAEGSSDDDSEAIHAIVRGRLSRAERVASENHGAFSAETASALAQSIQVASATLASARDSAPASSTRTDLLRSLETSERIATFVETSAAIHQRTGLVIDDSRRSGRSRDKNRGSESRSAPAAISATLMMTAPALEIASTSAATSTPSRMRGSERPDGDEHDGDREEQEDEHEKTLELSVPEL